MYEVDACANFFVTQAVDSCTSLIWCPLRFIKACLALTSKTYHQQ